MTVLVKNRKDQIREIAQGLFRKKGYAGTSMRDIASAVGVEVASLYSHIKSKEEILDHICFEMADGFFKTFEEVECSSGYSPEENLERAVFNHIMLIIDHLDESAVFLHDWRYLSEPALTRFKEMRDDYEERFVRIFRKGVDEGYFRPADEKLVVLTIFSSMNWIYNWYDPEGNLTPEEIAGKMTEIILKGIKNN